MITKEDNTYMENQLYQTYHVAICDDDPAYIKYVKDLFLQVKESKEELVFYEYISGEELLADLENVEKYDMLFLDVQLTGIDGNVTARHFREKFPDSLLVFCSGVYLPTPESFEVLPFRYLLKSYSKERMREELRPIFLQMRKMKPAPLLFGKREHKNFRIPLIYVEYIEIAKRGSVIYTYEDGERYKYSSGTRVGEHYVELRNFGFAYAHNSYIVHLNSISTITATELELLSGAKLNISRSHSKVFKEKFADYLAQKY